MASSPIGSSLRAARERAGWSREALAYHAGLSGAAIAQIESGRRRDVRLASLVALAEALGVSVDYLARGPHSTGARLLRHRAFVYDSDRDYLATLVPYLRGGVLDGDAVLVIAANAQIRRLRAALGEDAARVDFHSSAGWLRSPIGAIDNFRAYLERRLNDGAQWARIVGEPIWSGRTDHEINEWIRFEAMFNLSFATWPATVVCPYDARSVSSTILTGAHHTHPELVGHGAVTPSPEYLEPEAVLLGS